MNVLTINRSPAILPDEILALIFGFLAALFPPDKERRLGWLGAAHVCVAWRLAALASSGLFARNLGQLSGALPTRMLHLAKDLPLVFELMCTDPRTTHGHRDVIVDYPFERVWHFKVEAHIAASFLRALADRASRGKPLDRLISLSVDDIDGGGDDVRELKNREYVDRSNEYKPP